MPDNESADMPYINYFNRLDEDEVYHFGKILTIKTYEVKYAYKEGICIM